MVGSVPRLLAVAGTASAAVLDLPVSIKGSYSSVKLDIGTPPKEHHLLFDTGSTTVWTVSTDCTEESCPYGNSQEYKQQYYNASASSTTDDLHVPGAIPYLGGDVKGEIYEDVFSVPGSSMKWNQTFLAANQSSWRWITADGFLGLGFSAVAEPNTTTLVETLLWDDKLSEPRFGLFWGTNLNSKGPQDGVLSIGGSHEDKYVDGKVVYAPIQKNDDIYSLWRVALKGINILVADDPTNKNSTVETHVGSYPTTHLAPNTFPSANVTWPTYGQDYAVFDTGAGGLSVPDDSIAAMYYNLGWDYQKLLSGEQRFTCEAMNSSWAVSLILGPEDQENIVVSMRGDEFLRPGSQCQPPFNPSGRDSFALVGTTFLQRFYTVWDFGADRVAEYKPRIGFGKLKKEFDYLHQS